MSKILVNREQLAWAAGFFNGEGCTWYRSRENDIGRSSGSSIGMQVSQSGPSNIDPPYSLIRFQEIVNIGRSGRRNEARQPHYQYSWDWRVTTWEEVQYVGALLFSFLTQIKCDQFLSCMRLYEDLVSFQRGIGRPRKETIVV